MLYYYRTGINALKSKGYVAGKNLHGLGFDFRYCKLPLARDIFLQLQSFVALHPSTASQYHKLPARGRQSNRTHSKALLEKLEAMSAANGGARVNIVSHSMGGLVTKFLLAQYPQAFERLVRFNTMQIMVSVPSRLMAACCCEHDLRPMYNCC